MSAIITLNNIKKTFETENGAFAAIKGVSAEFEEGSVTIIGGANGSGKSVLMSIIAGLDEPTEGSVEISGTKANERGNAVGLVFQEADTQILGETALEDVAFGPENIGLPKAEVAKRAKEALEQTGLLHRADFPARFLSGGQKRRLAVAGILAMEKQIIIFDEPYANLDYTGVKQVNALIMALMRKRKTIIILTHELEKCLSLSEHFIVLFEGEKVFDGKSKDALNENLEAWGIRNPLKQSASFEDLLWV